MRTQQLFHLSQIPSIPFLGSWLGDCQPFVSHVLVMGPQQSKGIGDLVRFLVVSHQDSNQSSPFCMRIAPDVLIWRDVPLCDIHQHPRAAPLIPSFRSPVRAASEAKYGKPQ